MFTLGKKRSGNKENKDEKVKDRVRTACRNTLY
jgi:hypothetical protein